MIFGLFKIKCLAYNIHNKIIGWVYYYSHTLTKKSTLPIIFLFFIFALNNFRSQRAFKLSRRKQPLLLIPMCSFLEGAQIKQTISWREKKISLSLSLAKCVCVDRQTDISIYLYIFFFWSSEIRIFLLVETIPKDFCPQVWSHLKRNRSRNPWSFL